ncbi:cobyrinic acid ac-diamide synthase (plasmid) [Stanieria cyanosphaera PCC 7437]|uniref:Cobyrinic acid ac-diamide synthase n=1 Tax=Stanieria cyanosphaera (strain ATCC 29371 / PCC 7437) TaxID=111780 RepID=K9Y0E7_STAC7|nr:ParA family protein [Stanieria cyanosphaera]AFZ38300.1 cobyrinic acid ac-diamide synthase [Stanieria cyanosphaera PCC 7437]
MSIRLAVISNAGGSGKTTLSTHLAWSMSQQKLKVCLMDLDPQGSLTLFCGLDTPEPEHTIATVLQDNFDGNWTLTPCWSEYTDRVDICQGGMVLVATADELVVHKRGAYVLGDRLQDYPLPHEVLIFDCPATLGPLPLMALAACTHIVIPVQLEPKSIQGAAKLLEWYYYNCQHLRLRPIPEIIGFIPNQYNPRRAAHREILKALPEQLQEMNIQIFAPIRDSTEFVNASGQGLPLHLYRKTHPAVADFQPLVSQILKILGKPSQKKTKKAS